MRKRLPLLLCLVPSLALSIGAAPSAAASGRLTFIKKFEGSRPEYVRVTVDRTGRAVYQGGSIEEPDEPEEFQLSASTTREIFRLAAELQHFRGIELEAARRVAHMGEKLFRYEEAGERTEVRYNYTENRAARELQQLLERIGRGRDLIGELDYRLQFDRLGVLDAIRQLQGELNAGKLVDPEQFIPVLQRVVDDRRLMRLARAIARDLLRRIGSGHSRLQFEHVDPRSGAYTRLVVDEQGTGVYERRNVGAGSEPRALDIPAAVAERLWELVRYADYFRGLESAGQSAGGSSGYRLTYETASGQQRLAFSHPPNAILAEIVHLFQKLIYQEDLRQRLQAALEGESLMAQVILRELERALRSDSLAEPKGFVPLLKQIANGGETHPRVREQAEALLGQIQSGE